MVISLTPEGREDTPLIKINFRFDTPDAMNRLEINVPRISLGDDLKFSDKIPVDIKHGFVSITAKGKFSRERSKIPFSINLSNLAARPSDGKALLGLDPDISRAMLENIEEVQLTGEITGSLTSPRVRFDTDAILKNLESSLKKAGRVKLKVKLDKTLNHIENKLASKLDKKLKEKIPEGYIEGLSNDLFDNPKKKGSEAESGKDREKKTLESLRKLF
jgi:hypothetical protein